MVRRGQTGLPRRPYLLVGLRATRLVVCLSSGSSVGMVTTEVGVVARGLTDVLDEPL